MPPTIAGYPVTLQGMAGGMLSLRISLGSATLTDLARTLAKLEGVRVTSGPSIAGRGDCFVVHCPGFKLVLSADPQGGDFAPALLSRAIEPTLAITCELASVFARLMKAPTVRPERQAEAEPPAAIADRSGWSRTSTLRRTSLQPGKTLARKTPLTRKTPLSRGRLPKP
jgi:hypothetical protein